jgi:hypothetical protein
MRNDLDHASSLKKTEKIKKPKNMSKKLYPHLSSPLSSPLPTETIQNVQNSFKNDLLTYLAPEFGTKIHTIDPSVFTRLTRTQLLMLFYLLFRSNPIDLYQFMAETNSSRAACYRARRELAELDFNVQIVESKSSPYYKLFPNKSILRATGLLSDTPDTPDTTPDLSPEKN